MREEIPDFEGGEWSMKYVEHRETTAEEWTHWAEDESETGGQWTKKVCERSVTDDKFP